jgi:hypothetical protein
MTFRVHGCATLIATLLAANLVCAPTGDAAEVGPPKARKAAARVAEPGAVLPGSTPRFAGKIVKTCKESTPDFPKPVAAPNNAPNVLLILTDNTGFGHAAASTPMCGS